FASLLEGHRIQGLHGHFETDVVPLLLEHLHRLAVGGDGRVTDDLDLGAHGAGLLEYGFCLVRIVLQAAALEVPGIPTWEGRVGHVTLTVKHRVMDGLAIDGGGRRSASALVLERCATEVELQNETRSLRRPEGGCLHGGM